MRARGPALQKDGFPAPKAPALSFAPFPWPAYPPFLSASLLSHEPPSRPSQRPFSSAPREAGVGTAQYPSPSEPSWSPSGQPTPSPLPAPWPESPSVPSATPPLSCTQRDQSIHWGSRAARGGPPVRGWCELGSWGWGRGRSPDSWPGQQPSPGCPPVNPFQPGCRPTQARLCHKVKVLPDRLWGLSGVPSQQRGGRKGERWEGGP